jgi:DNA-binding NarL/FixJ family response regulator
MNCAAFTLCRRGELVGFNDRAMRLVTNDDSFALSAAGIAFADPQEQRRLVKAVKRVLEGAPLQILTLTHRLHRFEVAVAGLKSREAQWSTNAREHASAVLVLVTELSRRDTERPFPHIAHALTAAEWRVAKAAAMGVSNAAIASMLDLSANTVKTHLRRVYQKLNVRRQGELVLLMGRYALLDDLGQLR